MKSIKYFSLILILICLSNNLHAQVPVINEPHHKPVLVNNYVRLLDVHINPGDTTQYHIHAAPSVIVHITHSFIGSQNLGEAPTQPAPVVPGQTRFAPYDEKPITHRVYNSGKDVFHVMDIELVKKNPSPDSCAAINNIETTINEKLVRVYKFDVSNNKSLNINKTSCAHLLICISGAVNTTTKKLTTGDYIFFNPNTAIAISNHQANSSTCVLLELK